MKCLRLAIAIIIMLAGVVSPVTGAPGVYEEIQKRGEIRIGISRNYPPLNFNAGKEGVEIEMARKLGEFLGVSVKLVPLEVKDYLAAMKNREVDIIIGGFSRNIERAREIWFSVPYLSITPAVLAQTRVLPQTKFGDVFEQNPLRTLWDLKRLNSFTFAVKKGSVYENLLKFEFPQMACRMVHSNDEGLALLERGEVNGFVHDSLYLKYIYQHSAGLRSTCTLLQGGPRAEVLCVGLPFGDIILQNQVNTLVRELTRQGHVKNWLKIYGDK